MGAFPGSPSDRAPRGLEGGRWERTGDRERAPPASQRPGRPGKATPMPEPRARANSRPAARSRVPRRVEKRHPRGGRENGRFFVRFRNRRCGAPSLVRAARERADARRACLGSTTPAGAEEGRGGGRSDFPPLVLLSRPRPGALSSRGAAARSVTQAHPEPTGSGADASETKEREPRGKESSGEKSRRREARTFRRTKWEERARWQARAALREARALLVWERWFLGLSSASVMAKRAKEWGVTGREQSWGRDLWGRTCRTRRAEEGITAVPVAVALDSVWSGSDRASEAASAILARPRRVACEQRGGEIEAQRSRVCALDAAPLALLRVLPAAEAAFTLRTGVRARRKDDVLMVAPRSPSLALPLASREVRA